MDLDHLENLINKITLRQENINSIAEYCVLNSRDIENQIATIIHKNFPMHYNEKMLALLELVSEIFLRTGVGEKRDERFFKPLAAKAKVYIEEISKRVKEVKPEHLQIVPNILAKWSIPKRELFAPNYMEKLKRIAEPIFLAANQYEEDKKNNLFPNYSKTFLMEYDDVKSYEPTNMIYNDFTKFEKISVEIGQINTEMKRLGLEKMTPEIRIRAAELRKKLESFTETLQEIICRYHVDFRTLREACSEEFEKLPVEAKQVLEKGLERENSINSEK